MRAPPDNCDRTAAPPFQIGNDRPPEFNSYRRYSLPNIRLRYHAFVILLLEQVLNAMERATTMSRTAVPVRAHRRRHVPDRTV